MSADIARLDVPLPVVRLEIAAQVLREAIAHEAELHDDYEVSALSEALFLVTHPEVAVATDADYGSTWAADLAARIADSETAWAAAHTNTAGGTA